VDERDIKFEKQGDGRWRSTPLGPNDEFTLTVTAPGYQSNSQQFSLPGEESGGVTRNRTVKLKK